MPSRRPMSAFPPKADIRLTLRRVRFVPKADKCAGNEDLFDHLVGAGEQRRWNFEPERSRGHEIDDEFELGGLHDRQVGSLGAFEDLTGIDADLTPRSEEHTSELQSLRHLVCRLLLEKKKINEIQIKTLRICFKIICISITNILKRRAFHNVARITMNS